MSIRDYIAIGALAAAVACWIGWGAAASDRDEARKARDAAVERADAQTKSARGWEATTGRLSAELTTCQANWLIARSSADNLRRQQAESDDELAALRREWSARWEARPQSCHLALLDMERACQPALGRIE